MREQAVIYVMTSMKGLDRVFTVALVAWLSTSWALPTCCWSMTAPGPVSTATLGPPAHHHEPIAADRHTHHQEVHRAPGTVENGSPSEQSMKAASEAQDCATERAVALAPTGASSSLKWARATDQAAPPEALALHAADRAKTPRAPAPPGTSDHPSAFQSPLRI